MRRSHHRLPVMLNTLELREIQNLRMAKGFPDGSSGKEFTCQCRRHRRCGFDPWVRKIPWRRERQSTPIFLPGKSHDRGGWWATVHGVAKSRTRLRNLTFTFGTLWTVAHQAPLSWDFPGKSTGVGCHCLHQKIG